MTRPRSPSPPPSAAAAAASMGTLFDLLPIGAYRSAADVLLVVEVADSSLRFDRDTKMRLYAAHGIAEAWLVDVRGQRLIRHRAPQDGAYALVDEPNLGAVLADATGEDQHVDATQRSAHRRDLFAYGVAEHLDGQLGAPVVVLGGLREQVAHVVAEPRDAE